MPRQTPQNSAATSPHQTLKLPQDLGDGLVMRLATPDDIETVATFNQQIHEEEHDPPDSIKNAIIDLMSGNHPTTKAADFVLVEDTKADNKLVSTSCLIPQVWAYEGIPFPAGQPEFVGTDPAYRRRGLTRAIMTQIHALSQAYGHLAEGITGIFWFYRQFDYEYALSLGGGRNLDLDEAPPLPEGQEEPYQIRPATAADIPLIIQLHRRQGRHNLVTNVIDEAYCRFILFGQREGTMKAVKIFCLLDETAQVVGYYMTQAFLWGSRLPLHQLALAEGVSMHAILPTVARALQKQGEALAEQHEGKLKTIYFGLASDHPAFTVFQTKLRPGRAPYAWYIRVADLPAFIRHIAPALEKRLAGSVVSGYTGTLNITFYRNGLQLVFEKGQLKTVSDWESPEVDDTENRPHACFPPLIFLQLLFGHRSLAELRYAFADCWAADEAALLLDILFPKKASWLQPLG